MARAERLFLVMHRSGQCPVRQGRAPAKGCFASISLGVKKPDYDTVDIRRSGHHARVHHHRHRPRPCRQREEHDRLPGKAASQFVIAGNVGTPEAVIDLENWGADATKVHRPGKVCITKLKTGFGTGGWRLFRAQVVRTRGHQPIIADGGIRSHGDIAKSIRFGASMVMIGSLFAGREESPGKTVEENGRASRNTTARHPTSTRASTSTSKASAFSNP